MLRVASRHTWRRGAGVGEQALAGSTACLCRHSSSAYTSGDVPPVYPAQEVERRWQQRWQAQGFPQGAAAAAGAGGGAGGEAPETYYVLSQFPYPSGQLHVGHFRVYSMSDCIGRTQRMLGRRVLHPMGWDAFGLPAENAAIERGVAPSDWTLSNIAQMRKTFDRMGIHFDWEAEVTTCLPEYYRWTQSLFLDLWRNGLAVQREGTVNWDPVDQTVLANEQVDADGRSWRSGAMVEQRKLRQWYLCITRFADELLHGLDDLPEWPEQVKAMQRHWIGPSKGTMIDFANDIQCFTTRVDTLMGVTFVAVGQDHPVVARAGVALADGMRVPGVTAVHPVTKDILPVFLGDHVVSDYGTAAVMGVPAHDQRDYDFAVRNNLPIKQVIQSAEQAEQSLPYVGRDGLLINSGVFNGMSCEEARQRIPEALQQAGTAQHHTQYRLRDWLISRQRYWGAPIPIVHCDACGVVPVPEEQLPVLLPEDVRLHGKGGSPLASHEAFASTPCPECGHAARRETDTMDTFVDSSWYFLRFTDAANVQAAFARQAADQWMPVDSYVGGVEHAILHLLYARFIHRFLRSIGRVTTPEPFRRLLIQGLVMGTTYKSATGRYLSPEQVETQPDGRVVERGTGNAVEVSVEKMSKSKHNGITPDAMMQQYGADVARLFILFKAPPELPVAWDTDALRGPARWLDRVYQLVRRRRVATASPDDAGVDASAHADADAAVLAQAAEAVQQVRHDITETHRFNTAIAKLMALSNTLARHPDVSSPAACASLDAMLVMMAPLAPHFASHAWEMIHPGQPQVLEQAWPDQAALQHQLQTVRQRAAGANADSGGDGADAMAQVVFQVDGRFRGSVSIPEAMLNEDVDEDALMTQLQASAPGSKYLRDQSVARIIVLRKGRNVVNVVTRRDKA